MKPPPHWLGARDSWCLRTQKEGGCPAGDEVRAVLELVVPWGGTAGASGGHLQDPLGRWKKGCPTPCGLGDGDDQP